MRAFVWPIRIYYEDTDAGGVVYHANYVKFFERARTEMLRAIGVSQQKLLLQKAGFIVPQLSIDFRKPARLDDELTVVSKIVQVKRASLVFCQELVNPVGDVLCQAKVKVAYVCSDKIKPQAIPQAIIQELTQGEC